MAPATHMNRTRKITMRIWSHLVRTRGCSARSRRRVAAALASARCCSSLYSASASALRTKAGALHSSQTPLPEVLGGVCTRGRGESGGGESSGALSRVVANCEGPQHGPRAPGRRRPQETRFRTSSLEPGVAAGRVHFRELALAQARQVHQRLVLVLLEADAAPMQRQGLVVSIMVNDHSNVEERPRGRRRCSLLGCHCTCARRGHTRCGCAGDAVYG